VLRYVASHSPRVIRRKPILSEQALPVLRRSPRTRSCPILVDAEGDCHADSLSTNEVCNPQLTNKDRGFRGIAPFIAVLTFLIAPANMAQTRGASQASGKRHVVPVRNSAAPTGASLMEPGRHTIYNR
jgi:hypothetical protein